MNDLSKYKRTMYRRGFLILVPTLLSAIGILILRFGRFPFLQEHTGDFERGFRAGMIGALLACCLLAFGSILHTCRNPERLRKAYIEETDERSQLISLKAFSTVGWFLFCTLPPAVLIASFFSRTVFLTLLAVMISFVAVLLIAIAYYKRSI